MKTFYRYLAPDYHSIKVVHVVDIKLPVKKNMQAPDEWNGHPWPNYEDRDHFLSSVVPLIIVNLNLN